MRLDFCLTFWGHFIFFRSAFLFYIFLTDSMQKVPAANLHITSSAAQTMLGFRSGKKEKEIHVMSNSNRSNKLVQCSTTKTVANTGLLRGDPSGARTPPKNHKVIGAQCIHFSVCNFICNYKPFIFRITLLYTRSFTIFRLSISSSMTDHARSGSWPTMARRKSLSP